MIEESVDEMTDGHFDGVADGSILLSNDGL